MSCSARSCHSSSILRNVSAERRWNIGVLGCPNPEPQTILKGTSGCWTQDRQILVVWPRTIVREAIILLVPKP